MPEFGSLLYCLLIVAELATIARALLRPHREPASRIAWVVVIAAVPVLGIVAYLLFGDVEVGRRRRQRAREVLDSLPPYGGGGEAATPRTSDEYGRQFGLGASVSGFPPVGGNQARIFSDSDESIDALVADIDAAQDHVHIEFYIWLADRNGTRVAEAMQRAAARGVTCRVMVDALGSRALFDTPVWKGMERAGVKLAIALPYLRQVFKGSRGRIDLRNHRKIVVIDDRITYCGSQNCADAAFRVKAKYAPWVDVLMRVEGPLARQNQCLFAVDWMIEVDEDLRGLLRGPVPSPREPGFTGQVIGTGPTARRSSMPEVFESLMYAAREVAFITTPYFVPNEAMHTGLCSAARRGVDTTLILPARNDSWVVSAASKSYYGEMLEAGVKLFEFQGGLLHAKTFTLDGQMALVGSANMDRRSFDLNYENNILIDDPEVTAEVCRIQEAFRARSREVDLQEVEAWPMTRRLWNNSVAMVGPLL